MRETECLTERVNTIKREDGEERREEKYGGWQRGQN
jgi:hypothetical protein